MGPSSDLNPCEQSEATCAYAVQVLRAGEMAAAETHIASCPDCRRELENLRPMVGRFVSPAPWSGLEWEKTIWIWIGWLGLAAGLVTLALLSFW